MKLHFKPFQVPPIISLFPVNACKEEEFLTLTVAGREPALCRRAPANWNMNWLVRDEEGQRQDRKGSRWMSDEVSWLSFFSLILRMNAVKVNAVSLHCWASSGKDSSRRHSATMAYLSAWEVGASAEQLNHLHAPQLNRSVMQAVIYPCH